MHCSVILFLALIGLVTSASHQHNKHCKKNLNSIEYSLREQYCDQPLFVTFVQKTPDNLLIDNICHTLFPLPDDPDTFVLYISRVYCDGSNEIISTVATDFTLGHFKYGSPYCTFMDTVFGYAGCDTYLIYRCFEFGECGSDGGSLVFGLSAQPYTIGISCLRKVEEIVASAHIPDHEYYVLPMKLPNRCVTQQLCLKPENPFFNHLPGHRGKDHHSSIIRIAE